MFKYGSNADVVCDRYDVVDSINACERARKVQALMQEMKIHNEQMPLPKQRSKFLSNLKNKANVGDFLFAPLERKV